MSKMGAMTTCEVEIYSSEWPDDDDDGVVWAQSISLQARRDGTAAVVLIREAAEHPATVQRPESKTIAHVDIESSELAAACRAILAFIGEQQG